MFPTLRSLIDNPGYVPPPIRPFRYRSKPFVPRPPTFVRRFETPFAELVRSGAKLQTICKPPRRTPKPGDLLILRTWEGTIHGTRTQRLLRRAIIISVSTFELPNLHIDDFFARAEGYNNLKHLLLHFKLPFRGILIRWNPISPAPTVTSRR